MPITAAQMYSRIALHNPINLQLVSIVYNKFVTNPESVSDAGMMSPFIIHPNRNLEVT